jgi:hypothetical protein
MSTLSDEQIAQIEKLAWEHARVKWSTPPGYQFDDAELIEFAGAVIEADRAVREKGASPAPADPTVAEVQEYALLWAREVHKLLPLAGKDCNTLDDLEAFLRRLAALAPSPAGPPAEPNLMAALDLAIGELRGIRDSNWREWDKPHNTTDEFAGWAKSRAAYTLSRIAGLLVVGDAPSPAGERETGRFVRERDPQTGEWGPWIPVHPAAQPAAPSSSGSHEEGA